MAKSLEGAMAQPIGRSAADESTPLLLNGPAAAGGSSDETREEEDEEITEDATADEAAGDPKARSVRGKVDVEQAPFPRTQVFVLCYARLLEPVAFFSIFSFINEMVWSTGNVKETDVGFYSGLIESLFSLTQMTVLIPWGRAADRFGRKPTLLVSLVGVTVASTLFGFSKRLWQMIVLRCAAGVFAGTLVTLQTLLAENTTSKTQARAFSILSFTTNLGILLGPFLGGVLCNPVDQYPGLFGSIDLFKVYPYALPTMATGLLGLSVVLTTGFFVKETLRSKVAGDATVSPPMSTLEVVKSPGVVPVLFIYANIMVLAYGYTAILPVYCFTEQRLGGLGFSPLQISMVLGFGGLMQTVYTLFVFPFLQHRFGTIGILRGAAATWPFFFLAYPMCNLLLRNGMDTAFWIVGPLSLGVGSGVAMAFTAIQLAINDIAPSRETLGTTNAAALMLSSGLRAGCPALFGSLFAIGIRNQVLAGHLVWLVLIVLALCLTISVRWLPERASGRLARKTDEEED